MVSRVATYFQNQTSLRTMQQANAGLALSTYQITTGNKTNKLADMSSDINQILGLREVMRQAETYQTNITNAVNFLKTTESALDGMTDLLSQASATATLGRNENSAETRASLAPKAQSLAEAFYNLFNTEFNGTYVFSGQQATNGPVSGVATATAFPGAPVPTTYYQGDSDAVTTVTGPASTTSYGVLGNDPAFAEMKAGLEALWYGLQNNSTTDIDSAVSTLKSAQSKLSTMVGRVGGDMNTLEQLGKRYDASQLVVKEQLDSKEKIDISEALSTFSQQQATLEASMLVTTRINSISLLDYLR